MTSSPYLIPQPVGQLLARLPAFPGSMLFVTGLNLALAKKLAPDVTQLLAGKRLRLAVLDARVAFDFAWQGNRFVACERQEHADLTVSANAFDFLQLARRQEDPDTLFFSRRLCMEGDTELGLLFKNTLDAIELPLFDPEVLKPAHVLARLKAKLATH